MLNKILPITEAKLKILVSLYKYNELNLASISKEINMPSSNIMKILPDLKDILEIKKLGKIKLYSINEDFIKLFEHIIERYRLESNLGINIGLIDMIKKLNYVEEIYVFGSFAKGNFNEESDLDLIIITEIKDLLEKQMKNVKKITNLPIEIIYINKEKFNQIMRTKDNRFYNILKNKNQRIKVY